jgi:cytochrome c oxidase subunit 2
VPYGPPKDVSVDGHIVDGAFGYLTISTAICFAIVVAMLLVVLIFHRRRASRQAHYTHGDRRRDHVLTLAVAIGMFLGIDAVLAGRSMGHLKTRFWNYPVEDREAVRVEVTARQWAWTFRLAGPDGRFGTPDDVVTLNELHVPVGKAIYLKLRSLDVIHSLYLPNFRTKIDAVPGSTTRLWFQARQTGTFEVACAQHCGVNHYRMRGVMVVEPQADFDAWVDRAALDGRLRWNAKLSTPAWDWEAGE